MSPEVEVVVVSYAGRDLLRRCLSSLEAQQGVTLGATVVDNASPDGSAEMVRREFPRFRIDALSGNLGFARANNLALGQARSETVLVLNPDTVLPPTALRACLDQLAREPGTGILSPRLVDEEGREDRRCRRGFPTIWSSLCTLTGLDGRLGPNSGEYSGHWVNSEAASDVVSVSGAFMLIRRAALDEVGLFDERYFMFGEDMDLCLRMRQAGWSVRYWPGVDVVHIGGASTSSGYAPTKAREAWFRSMAPFLRRHRPGPRGWISAAVVGSLAEGALALERLRGRGR